MRLLALAFAALATLAFAQDKKAPAARAALSVTTTQPQASDLALRLAANGSVAAWQEAIVGAEVGGLRLAELRADVGDNVRRGQVLAVFDAAPVEADVAQAKAALTEAEAAAGEARANAARVRELQSSGAVSAQEISKYFTAEKTAEARVSSARAVLDQQLLRLRHTRVVASDGGIVSSRTATLGSVVNPGQELFRLIRQGRLEWRAEVPAADLPRIRAGQAVTVSTAGGVTAQGRVRMIGPVVDAQTRNALVYVDLQSRNGFRPGMFASGEFAIGRKGALTVPQQAIAFREGFAYVFTLGPESRVAQQKVQLGRREGDRYEVLSGLKGGETLVADGASFLADGDTVRVVQRK